MEALATTGQVFIDRDVLLLLQLWLSYTELLTLKQGN